jgi:hypothetical protein
LNALYFATHDIKRLPGWNHSFPVGHYWRVPHLLSTSTMEATPDQLEDAAISLTNSLAARVVVTTLV